MKWTLRTVICVALFVSLVQVSYGQVGMAGQQKPYQNLAKWYGTQSAPTLYAKAQWALDDINTYRESIGLRPVSERMLKSKVRIRSFDRRTIFRTRG
jgi:hypothetical protein